MTMTMDMYAPVESSSECRADIKDLIESEIAAIFTIEVQKAAKEFKLIGRSSKKRRVGQHS